MDNFGLFQLIGGGITLTRGTGVHYAQRAASIVRAAEDHRRIASETENPIRDDRSRWSRYLLTQVFTGTSGNDTITISLGTSNQQQVKINSTLYQPTDDDFEVDALGGDDTIKITGISPGLASNNNVTVDSGAGNDTITASVEGGVTLTIDNSDPTSTDTLTIDDSGNSSSNVEDTRIETSNGNPEFHQELTGLDGLLYYENINAVTYKGSVFGETIYVDAPISGVTLDLGNAANTIDYDGDDDVLFGTVAPMTINGGTGTDKVIFDDASGTGTTQTYAFTPTTALNQTLSGIDSIELDRALFLASSTPSR